MRLLLGVPFDLDAFAAWAAREDPILAAVVARLRGFRPPLQPDPWEALVTSITAQQVSLHAAFAIRGRLVERFGVHHEHAWAFPTREPLAAAREDEIVAGGFSRRKAEYLVALARSDLDLDASHARSPDDEVRAAITACAGSTRDGRLVPRPSSRPAARVAGGRSRATQGRLRPLPVTARRSRPRRYDVWASASPRSRI